VSPKDKAFKILLHGERVELFALDGDRTHPTESNSSSGTFINSEIAQIAGRWIVPVIGSVVLTDRDQIERVRGAALSGLGSDALAGWCFQPRHALRVHEGAASATLFLCYECSSAKVIGPKDGAPFSITVDNSRTLNEVLGLHDIPIFAVPRPARQSNANRARTK
jgi:hypothetical protein